MRLPEGCAGDVDMERRDSTNSSASKTKFVTPPLSRRESDSREVRNILSSIYLSFLPSFLHSLSPFLPPISSMTHSIPSLTKFTVFFLSINPMQNFDMDDFNDDEGGLNDADSSYCATPPRSMLLLSHSPSPSSSLTPIPLPLSRPQLSLTPRLSVSTNHHVRVLYIQSKGVDYSTVKLNRIK